MTDWTTERVLALAPDAASIKAARGLAAGAKWLSSGTNPRALWGECRGSGSKPYRTGIDLSEPAFHCSCPSRKFPCKHSLGLLLLFAADPAAVRQTEPPDWMTAWLARREQAAQRKQAKAAVVEADPEQRARKQTAKAKRISQRQTRVEAGLAELERWLHDLIRQGLAQTQNRPARYWDEMAARMVDAQAPGIARWLREMASIPASGEGWSERLLARLGRLYLLLAGHRRLATLPEPVQADIRGAIGWTYKEEELPAEAWLRDRWRTLGQYGYEEERLRVRRTWLWGEASHRTALLLDFAYQGQPLDMGWVTGGVQEAELGFYPSHYPLRAMARNRSESAGRVGDIPACPTLTAFLSDYADALARQPWLESFPAALRDVLPDLDEEHGSLRDTENNRIPLDSRFTDYWRLVAVSGGYPLTVFGEWNGSHLLPLSVWVEDRLIPF